MWECVLVEFQELLQASQLTERSCEESSVSLDLSYFYSLLKSSFELLISTSHLALSERQTHVHGPLGFFFLPTDQKQL